MLAKGPLPRFLGSWGRALGCWIQGRGENCAGDGTQLPHPGTGFTFRSVLRIQMKVQTLALLGHFRTMNPPGPFSPLRRKANRVRQSQVGILAGILCGSGMHCVELRLAEKARAQWGRSRCWEPGKVCALAPGTRASTARQLSHRCLGSAGARAAGGAAALPLDRASCSPREAFPGTSLGANKRSPEALCAQVSLSTCHSSPQILPGTI